MYKYIQSSYIYTNICKHFMKSHSNSSNKTEKQKVEIKTGKKD